MSLLESVGFRCLCLSLRMFKGGWVEVERADYEEGEEKE